MSLALMTLVWRTEFPTQSQKLIALKLADHSNDEGGNIWPSKARVSREAGCSETTVQLTLRVFRECGILSVIAEGGKGPGNTTKYRINVPMLEALSRKEAKIVGNADDLTVIQADPQKGSESDGIEIPWDLASRDKGSDDTEKGVGVTDPKPSLKNHKEPSTREDSKSDLKSEVQSRALPSHTITANDPQWEHWIVHLRKLGRDDLALRATAAGAITTVGSRWPKDDSPLPFVKQTGLTEQSKRVAGGA